VTSVATPGIPALRWGTAGSRTVWGVILIISGAVAIAGVTTTVLWQLLLPGVIAHVAGWCLLPSAGWRRVVAILLSTPAALLLLAGPRFVWVLVLPYIAWLLVRHRPARSYPTVTFVLAGAVILPRIYGDPDGMLPALAIELAVIAASAWAARAVAGSGRSRRPPEVSA
jgi:hypothetical protein